MNSERLYAEVNGKRKIVAYISGEIEPNYEKSRARETTLPGFQFIDIGVFSNDFAGVDFRENLCYHSRPKKANFGETARDKINLLLFRV